MLFAELLLQTFLYVVQSLKQALYFERAFLVCELVRMSKRVFLIHFS